MVTYRTHIIRLLTTDTWYFFVIGREKLQSELGPFVEAEGQS